MNKNVYQTSSNKYGIKRSINKGYANRYICKPGEFSIVSTRKLSRI